MELAIVVGQQSTEVGDRDDLIDYPHDNGNRHVDDDDDFKPMVRTSMETISSHINCCVSAFQALLLSRAITE